MPSVISRARMANILLLPIQSPRPEIGNMIIRGRDFILCMLLAALCAGCGTQIQLTSQKLRAVREANRMHFEDPDVSNRIADLARGRMADLYAVVKNASRQHRAVSSPRLIKTVSPQYPLSRRIKDVQGGVWIAFAVDVDGKTIRQESIPDEEAISDPAFVQAAIAAVQQWRFEPGKIDGVPTIFPLCVPVVFELQ